MLPQDPWEHTPVTVFESTANWQWEMAGEVMQLRLFFEQV